ncbi:autotransporter domain-containing protein [Flavobacterium haoranii]|uniref:Outer membrane protein n=1 Tax=Flavobacterium haoranii TaxID=683124 RepID=A0A1M6BFJ3_9FLAO|nr:autotransporter domain-containing protein [Flavobacterium haoranii]SHI47437.1 outer membrane protein [Flavobacterium haoranii]
MKKVLLSAVAILGFTFANAQEEATTSNGGFAQGDVFVSGALTLNSSKTGDFKMNSFVVAPKVGYFVTENIAIGGMLAYSNDKVELGNSATNSGFGVGAFGRYYFTPANQFSLFAELAANYMTYDNEFGVDYDGSLYAADYKNNVFGVNLGAGMNYFVSPNFSLEAGVGVLGFSSDDNGGDGADATNTFSFGGNWTAVTFGVNYKF